MIGCEDGRRGKRIQGVRSPALCVTRGAGSFMMLPVRATSSLETLFGRSAPFTSKERPTMSESQPSRVFTFDNSDPEMQRAYESARATFRYFWREIAWERQ